MREATHRGPVTEGKLSWNSPTDFCLEQNHRASSQTNLTRRKLHRKLGANCREKHSPRRLLTLYFSICQIFCAPQRCMPLPAGYVRLQPTSGLPGRSKILHPNQLHSGLLPGRPVAFRPASPANYLRVETSRQSFLMQV